MRRVVVALGAISLVLVLSAAPGYAQAPAKPPVSPPPAQPAVPAPAAQPPAAFPQGAKIAIVNLQQIAQLSVEGKTSTAKVQALIAKKQAEAAAKAKQLQDNQTKLTQGGTLLNDAARGQLEKEIEKLQVEADRFQQDAQAEITELQMQLQGEFQQKLFPVLNEMVKEKGLHLLLSAADSGVIAGDPGIDLTAEAIKRFDSATSKPAAAPPAAPAPAAPATKP
ncbi:MAG TPA: OmpH family outer membrane protein [Vicinamibacterales bacterium]|nr:OmpH family outer membrane protein [Vicinamibacterales bacterium]